MIVPVACNNQMGNSIMLMYAELRIIQFWYANIHFKYSSICRNAETRRSGSYQSQHLYYNSVMEVEVFYIYVEVAQVIVSPYMVVNI